MTIPLILTGYGNVGKAFVRLLAEKHEDCRTRYGLDFDLIAVVREPGMDGEQGGRIFHPGRSGRDAAGIPSGLDSRHDLVRSLCATPEKRRRSSNARPRIGGRASPSSSFSMRPSTAAGTSPPRARARWSSILKISGPKPGPRNLSLKFSGATAAALPTLDVATISLAGAKILGFEGILTGTTNYILSRLEQGLSFEDRPQGSPSQGDRRARSVDGHRRLGHGLQAAPDRQRRGRDGIHAQRHQGGRDPRGHGRGPSRRPGCGQFAQAPRPAVTKSRAVTGRKSRPCPFRRPIRFTG